MLAVPPLAGGVLGQVMAAGRLSVLLSSSVSPPCWGRAVPPGAECWPLAVVLGVSRPCARYSSQCTNFALKMQHFDENNDLKSALFKG